MARRQRHRLLHAAPCGERAALSCKPLGPGPLGEETDAPLTDYIEFGVDDKDGNALLRERRLVSAKDVIVSMVVAGRPARAGIDPDHKLIDRKPGDNLVEVEHR